MVTTIASSFGQVNPTNEATRKVIARMSGYRTEKQIVQEFFGLREEVVYEDDGETVKDYISDFKDLKALEEKGVAYNPKLMDYGIDEAKFNALFTNGLPTLKSNAKKDGTTKGGESEGSTGETKPTNTRKPRATKKK